ncbi:MAG: hypothetical protein NTV63_04330 [Candidatus Woesearchaeota archaeon]|nr:hypothetical protein [Candidatus Woesearchaeota archaeon]
MKKIIFAGTGIFVLALIILTSGCTSYGGINFFSPFQGSEGLIVSFVKNSPPEKVYSSSSFPVVVSLENQGALDIKRGILVIGVEDFGEKSIAGGKDIIYFNLYGKNTSKAFGGEKDVKSFTLKAPEIESKSEQESSVSIKTCYPYDTFAQLSLCLDTGINDESDEKKPCEMQESISLSEQGAPVAVSLVEIGKLFSDEKSLKFAFTIHVRNVGIGYPVSEDSVEKFCSSEKFNEKTDRASFGKASVKAYLAGKELTCTPRTSVDLSSGEDFVTCYTESMPVKSNAYSTVLNIKLEYGYVEIITQKFRIIRPT